ncbi:hypothetical protein [Azotobacter beijerinckii]|uniref:hypothetical protein n=1 Tax=Azotobacter beijerinckii TaxID=170623 RepID=UPI0029529EC4|nr:hypothetical protein [Azotobacter beijerinckii]MDV7211073.1 hypothetical protein [Azotobacter beijerinckii]
MKPAAIIASCLEQQAGADSSAALDYATGCTVGSVLALFAVGLLNADECDAGTAAARDADRARRLAWGAARVAALGTDQPMPPPTDYAPHAPQDAPGIDPQAWGFLGLAYCLADCLGDVATNPGSDEHREPLRHMAAAALRAWQAVHAEHGEELASLHACTRHAEKVGTHSVGAVSVALLQLLIGEGVRHG